ncbi:hypothetical protein HPB48_005734 [Haemaphysalis longicornis]|uniref:Uncharacterized protein n=1 Tax=Haemaphysalis longicornis TaxID=44386 RepID=A0A9J6FB93_HAELO|nr:hypothetical protein HPB48_005734 [Haemaphysalis longicornis]
MQKKWPLFPVIGFREHISTQDTAPQLKEDVTGSPDAAQNRAILALDLDKRFDGVARDGMIEELGRTNSCERMFDYVMIFSKTARSELPLDRTHQAINTYL